MVQINRGSPLSASAPHREHTLVLAPTLGQGKMRCRRVRAHSLLTPAESIQGDWKNGRPDGSGTMTYQEGSQYDTYEDQWGAGRFHGNGKIVKGNGDKLEGNFRWGALHGFGI